MRWIVSLGILCSTVSMVQAWSFATHTALAKKIFENSAIQYSADKRGLNIIQLIDRADVEPQSSNEVGKEAQPHFGKFETYALLQQNLFSRPLSVVWAGYLIHEVGDASMPSNHAPALEVCKADAAENYLEARASTFSMVGWPSPAYYTEVLPSNYDAYLALHKSKVFANANEFCGEQSRFNNSCGWCATFGGVNFNNNCSRCKDIAYKHFSRGMPNSMRLATCVLNTYFNDHP